MTLSPLPDDTRLGRVTLAVSDLDAVTGFYRDAVGLRVRHSDGDRAVLGTAERDLLVLECDRETGPRPADAAGLFHTAFLFSDRGALGDALARVRDAGGDLTGASDHGVSEALYLRDPEGNGVELYRDRPRAEWPESDGEVAMDTLPLDVDALSADRAGDADAAGDSAPDGTAVGHVHLEVTDVDAAESFYVDGLGFDVRQRWEREALFVAAGGYHHHVGLNTWNGRSAPASGRGLSAFEVVVPDANALDSVRESLADAGVEVADDADETGEDDGDAALRVRDPDGIGVRIVAE
ncbi:VOC family protein [Halobaculum sp. CBA1158]|uniref:VOC family protein n=1 Tax=Halobaculum sp. CBA1158 TaxID=2904243 RepID=UPI001F459E50|nr:VOC family protein [Halobaculum sp. CBA1158]UIP01169.1 VOC family protein [Halobaculum sp. CBA1158]